MPLPMITMHFMNVGIPSCQSMVTIPYEEHVVRQMRNRRLRLQPTFKLIVFIYLMSSRSRESPTCKLPCHLLLIHKVHDHIVDIHEQSLPPIVSLDFEEEDAPMEGQSSCIKECKIKMKSSTIEKHVVDDNIGVKFLANSYIVLHLFYCFPFKSGIITLNLNDGRSL
jgi:hypothetical protein